MAVKVGTVKAPMFDLVDAKTAEFMAKNKETLLPFKVVDGKKLERWNTKAVNSVIRQAVNSGASIENMAIEMTNKIPEMNFNSAVRNSRTAMTGAQNRGRIDRLKLSEGTLAEWMSTLDMRTRASHVALDGEKVKPGKKFSNGCRFPGDKDGAPSEVYNCRCTIVAYFDELEDLQDIPRFTRWGKTMTYEKWKERALKSPEFKIQKELQKKWVEIVKATKVPTPKPAPVQPQIPPDSEEWENRVFQNLLNSGFSESDAKERFDKLKTMNFVGTFEEKEFFNMSIQLMKDSHSTMLVAREEKKRLTGYGNYIQTGNSFNINRMLREGVEISDPYDRETIDLLNEVIARNTLDKNVQVTRFVGNTYFKNTFGEDIETMKELIESNPKASFAEKIVKEKGFMSTSGKASDNVFTNRPVKMKLYAEKGTHAYVTDNYGESEIIFGTDTEYEIVDIKFGDFGTAEVIAKILKK